MNHQQEEVVVKGYSEVTNVTSADPPPPPPPLPPPPPPPLLPPLRTSKFRILVTAFIGACIFIGILALIIWLIYRPRTPVVAVATATLARFDLSNATSTTPVLSYNLTAVVSVSNPNGRVSIYYDQLEAAGLYQEERFGRAALPVSFQGTRHADAVPALLVGDTPMDLGGFCVTAYGEDSRIGVFPVDLWVSGVVRYKLGGLMTTTATTLAVKCHLALTLMVASGWVECIVIDT